MTAPIDRRVRLRDEIIFFLIAGQIINVVRDAAVGDLAIRSFDETELVDPRKSRHRADQTDVGAFRRFNRANSTVMRRMNVAYFESRAITRETAWSERGQTALVRQFRERIRLIHELRQLRATKEIANDRAERFRIDELLRRHAVNVDVEQGHALLHQTFGAGETDAALIGEQFADRADAATAEMIDIIEGAFAAAEVDEVLNRGDEIFVGQDALGKIDVDTELLIDLVTANATEIVFLRIKEQTLQQRTRIRNRRRITRTETTINIFERFFLIVRWILSQRFDDGVVIGNVDDLNFLDSEPDDLANRRERQRFKSAGDSDFTVAHFSSEDLGCEFFFIELLAQFQVLDIIEKLDDFLVRAVTERAEESRREEFPAALAAIG